MNSTRQWWAILIAASLSAWATAQHRTAGPTAAEQLKLFQVNQELMQGLLADALRLSQAETTLTRAAECHQVAKTLAKAIEQAASEPNPEPNRVAELGEHFTAIFQDGLAPTLAEARDQIAPGSQDYPRLLELQKLTRQSLADLQGALPRVGPLSQNRAVSQLREKLADLGQEFSTP